MLRKSPKGSGCYLTQAILTIDGAFDNAGFIDACLKALHRNENTRLRFQWEPDTPPRQSIGHITGINVERYDWSGHSRTRSQELLDIYISADRRLGYDVSMPLPFRLSLIRTAPDQHIFIFTISKIAADESSVYKFLVDMISFYTENRPFSDASCSGFKDYAAQVAANNTPHKSAEFWRRYFNGYDPFKTGISHHFALTANSDKRQQTTMALTTEEMREDLPPDLSYLVDHWKKKNSSMELHFLFLGAWALILSHLQGQLDIIFSVLVPVGSPLKNKIPAVGVNLIPVRVSITPDLSLLNLLKELKHRLHESAPYRHDCLTDIETWTQVPQGVGYADHQYVHHPLEGSFYDKFQLLTSPHKLRIIERYPALLQLRTYGTRHMNILYDRRRYSSRQVSDILRLLFQILREFCSGKDLVIGKMPLSSETGNIENRPEEQDHSKAHIHHLIMIQASVSPQAPAITCHQNQWRYGHLSNQIQNIAVNLSTQGFTPGDKALVMSSNPDHILIAVLGVFHCSGTCVPVTHRGMEDLAPILAQYSFNAILYDNTTAAHLPDLRIPKTNMEIFNKTSGTQNCTPLSLHAMKGSGHLILPMPRGEAAAPISSSHLAPRIETFARIAGIEPGESIFLSTTIDLPELLAIAFSALITGASLLIGRIRSQTIQASIRRAKISMMCLTLDEVQTYRQTIESQVFLNIRRLITFSHPQDAMPWSKETAEKQAMTVDWIHMFSMPETTGPFGWTRLSGTQVLSSYPTVLNTGFSHIRTRVLNHLGQPALPGTSGTLFIELPGTSPRASESQAFAPATKSRITENTLIDTGLHIGLDMENRYMLTSGTFKSPTQIQQGKEKKPAPIILIGNSVAAARGYKKADLKGHPFHHTPIFIHFYENKRSPSRLLHIKELAARCVADIIKAFPAGPYIIIGECQNSIIAHEAAHQLNRSGETVELLVIIDENWETSPSPSVQKEQGFFLTRQLNELKRFGTLNMVKKIFDRLKKNIGYYHLLDSAKEHLYFLMNRPIPEAVQFRKMETVFYKACEASRYTPPMYHSPTLLLYSEKWIKTHSPSLSRYYRGVCQKRYFPITHSEWFANQNIALIIQLIENFNFEIQEDVRNSVSVE